MSKESDLNAAASLVRLFVNGEIPTDVEWNVNPDVLADVLRTIGGFFTDTDAAVTTLTDLFGVDHDPVTGKNPAPVEWVPETNPIYFLATFQFALDNDRQADYRVGDRLRIHQGTGGSDLVFVAITGVVYSTPQSGRTTVSVAAAANAAPLVSTLAAIDRAFVRDSVRRIGQFDLLDGAVDDARILVDGVVVRTKLAPGSVDQSKIVDGEVVAGKLGPSAVGNTNLANQSVTQAKLANAAITPRTFDVGAVQDFAIANGAVQRQHIADHNVEDHHLAIGAVGTPQLHDGAVTTLKITDANVTTPKIADANVTPAKLTPLSYQSGAGINSLVPATYEQMGWGFVTIVGTANTTTKAVVFPQAFPASILNVQLTPIGIKSGADPTGPADAVSTKTPSGAGSTATNNMPHFMVQGGSLSKNGFTVLTTPTSPGASTWADGDRILFFWRAVGQ